MTNSSIVLYRPSILELARRGNFRAIAYWINSLLGPYGIYIRAVTSRSGCLNILVDFHQSRRREFYVALRKHLVRFICYRLWTLNSEKIRDVRIVARIAGEPDILWKQSVRIVTPANQEGLRQSDRWRHLARRGAAWVRFRVLRSAFVSQLAVASFFLCYWLIYWEMAGKHAPERPAEVLTFNALAQELPLEPSAKDQIRLGAPATNVPAANALLQLGEGIRQNVTATAIAQQFAGQLVSQVRPVNGEKVVALTFDDGPWDGTTEQVLDILQQNDIKATFFWVGQQIRTNPEIAKKVVAEGHAVGNHTWRHIMEDVEQLTAADEIGNTARLIYETTGVRTNLFRPPGGNLSGSMVPYAKQQKDIVVMWSVESDDYLVSSPIIVDNVLSRVHPGSIVLLHDGGGDRSQTVQALPQIISALRQQGYRFVTVPELLALHSQGDVTGAFQEPAPTGQTESVPVQPPGLEQSMPPATPTGSPYSSPVPDGTTPARSPYGVPVPDHTGTGVPQESLGAPLSLPSAPALDGGMPGTVVPLSPPATDGAPTEPPLNTTGEVPGMDSGNQSPTIAPAPGVEVDAMDTFEELLVGQLPQ